MILATKAAEFNRRYNSYYTPGIYEEGTWESDGCTPLWESACSIQSPSCVLRLISTGVLVYVTTV